MKAALKAFGRAFGIGVVSGVVFFVAAVSVPDAYGWLVSVCALVFLWAACMVAAARGRPLMAQAAVAVGISWGLLGAAAAAMPIGGAPGSTDWGLFFLYLVALPLAILATVSFVNWAWRWTWRKLHPDSGPRRLPVLWIICVLIGLGGMHSLATAIFLTLPWAILYGVLALAELGLATALYLRLRVGWVVAIVLFGLNFAADLYFGLRSPDADLTVSAIISLVALAIGLYLWFRRRHFGRAAGPRPRCLSAPGISALAVVLLVGGGVVLLMTVDEAPRSFPALEARVPAPPKEENGYFMLVHMAKKWPLEDDEQFQNVIDKMPKPDAVPSAEWLRAASTAVQKYRACLADGRKLAGMPHFVEVTDFQGIARINRLMPWLLPCRNLAQLFAISARVEAADGHWDQAIAESDYAIALGVLISKESDSIIQSLVGMADRAIGMAALREVACYVTDAPLLKAHLGPLLPEEVLREGYNLGVAGEFQTDVGLIREISTMSSAEIESQLGDFSPRIALGYLSPPRVRANPWLKVGMTTNIFGGWMQHMIIQPGTYVPVPSPPNPLWRKGHPGILRRGLAYLRFARDPAGYILSFMLLPAGERAEEDYYSSIANARMTRLFLALRCYQLEHGRLPKNLDALAPQYLKNIPLDPFTGKPFRYKPAGKRPRLWSVGPDGVTNLLPSHTEYGGDDVRVFLWFAGNGGGKSTAARGTPSVKPAPASRARPARP